MPAWIHDRAQHVLAKNPGMDKSTAFAIATQQAHKLGKTPKKFGTKQGKKDAKKKYGKSKKEYTKGANPGGLTTPKLESRKKKKSSAEEGYDMSSQQWADGGELDKNASLISFFDELTKIGVAGDDPSLLGQIGKSKTRARRASSPNPKFRVKQSSAHKDKTPGGKADDKQLSDYPKAQVAMGQKVEMEHTDDPALAREISADHLEEFPDYYSRLKKMEDKAEKESEKKANGDEGEGEGRAPTGKDKKAIHEFLKVRPKGQEDEEFHEFLEGKGVSVPEGEAVAYDMAGKAKVAYIPTGSPPMQNQNDPAWRLAKSQRVGTPDDPKGPQFKALNQLKPPKPPGAPKIAMKGVATPKMAKLSFARSQFAGGQLYPGPGSMRLPTSGRSNTIYLPSNLAKSGGPPSEEKGESEKRAATPAQRLAQSRRRSSKDASGPSVAQVSKPMGYGKPDPGAVKDPTWM